jgi:uncharacterized protein
MPQVFALSDPQSVRDLCRKHKISYLGLFGSRARGDYSEVSDVDILIDYEQPKSLFELARIKLDFNKLLGHEVDLTSRRNLNVLLAQSIQKDLVTIYEEKGCQGAIEKSD